MFSLNNFVMKTLNGMRGNYPEFQVREYALNWYSKSVLTEDNLIEIETWFAPPVYDDTTEESSDELIEESSTTE